MKLTNEINAAMEPSRLNGIQEVSGSIPLGSTKTGALTAPFSNVNMPPACS